jgi:hypothetical protein
MNRGFYEFPRSAAHLARQVTEGQTGSPEREFSWPDLVPWSMANESRSSVGTAGGVAGRGLVARGGTAPSAAYRRNQVCTVCRDTP